MRDAWLYLARGIVSAGGFHDMVKRVWRVGSLLFFCGAAKFFWNGNGVRLPPPAVARGVSYQDFLRGWGGAAHRAESGEGRRFNAADRGRLRRARFPDSDGNFPRKRGFEKLPALRRVGERLGGRWGRIPILSGELANGAARKSRTGSLEAQEGFFSR